MNTNDTAATYGKPMLLRDKAIESMVRNYVDRELSITVMDDKFDVAMSDASRAATATGEHVRDFYENLIHEGRLRVVEEVELRPNDYDANLDCSKCGWAGVYLYIEELEPFTHCPGCGRPLTKPSHEQQ